MATSIAPINPAAPSRQPQLAAAHGVVAMTFGSGTSIYLISSADQARTWSMPAKVDKVGALALGRHRGPRVAVLKDAIVVSAVAGEKKDAGAHAHGLPEAGNLLAWRSVDRGKSWKRAGAINDVPGSAREGLHAMVAGPDGSLFAAWLDLRVKGTQLYGSQSRDGGTTWSKNVAVYSSPEGTICQCCHPTLTIDAPGRLWAMWRNAMNGSRDMYVSSSTDGLHFEAARKLGEGTWKLDACPMDGGGLLVEDGRITSAWRRDGDIFLTEPGTAAERKISAGKDVAVARSSKHETYLVWTRDGGVYALLPGATESLRLAKEGGFATVIALEDVGVLTAWEAPRTVETKRLDPR